MNGVQAAVLMDGSADIARETQDLRVVVVPEINAGTASLAAAVINPAIGLGTFLAQLVLRQPLIAAGTREFHIDGTWADPKIDRVERDAGRRRGGRAGGTPPAAGARRRRRALGRSRDCAAAAPRAAGRSTAPQRGNAPHRAMKIAALQMVSTPDVARNLAAARRAARRRPPPTAPSWSCCPSTSA